MSAPHFCRQDSIACFEELTTSRKLFVEGYLHFEIGKGITWSGEVRTQVNFCPFCGFKSKEQVEEDL
jgi:hypothetical protein